MKNIRDLLSKDRMINITLTRPGQCGKKLKEALEKIR